MVKNGLNWWTNKWFSLINTERLGKALHKGSQCYHNRKSNFQIVDNTIVDSLYDRSFFGENLDPSISFKKFSEEEIEIISLTILTSLSYLSSIINNQLPENLYNDLKDKNIYLIPESIEDLEFKGYSNERYCDDTMAMFYSFGVNIDKDPFLLFKIRGFNIEELIRQYQNINIHKIKKISGLLDKNNKSKDRKRVNNKKFNKVLKSIDFDQIPYLKYSIELLLSTNPEFFRIDFKRVLMNNISSCSNHLVRSPWLDAEDDFKEDIPDFDWKYFGQIDTEGIEQFRKYAEKKFNDEWGDIKKYSSLKININKNYRVVNVSFLNPDPLLDYKLYEFFFDIPPWIVFQSNNYIKFSYMVFQFSHVLVEKIAIIPELLKYDNDKCLIRWIPALFSDEVNRIFKKLVSICPLDLILFDNHIISKEEQVKIFISLFLKIIITEYDSKLFKSVKSNDLYLLFFRTIPIKIPNQVIPLVDDWLSNLFQFENEHQLVLTVKDEDDGFIIDLKTINNDSVKKTLEKSDIKNRINLFNDIYLLEKYFQDIHNILDNDDKIIYDNEKFSHFYLNTIPILKLLNFKIKLPKNIEETNKPQLIVNMDLLKDSSLNRRSLLNLESLVDFDWKIAIADKKISLNEFKKIVKDSSLFLKLGNKHYLVDKEDTNIISEKIKNLPKKFKNNELLQTVLSSTYGDNEVNVNENILKLMDEIREYKDISIPNNLNGVLRPYQERGFSWLVQNIFTGFGSILADDMGLGKTLQVLATILYCKNNDFLNNKKVLIIVPTAIIYNWQNEIKKFTPSLSHEIFHGQNRTISPITDIVITSYGMVRSNFEDFAKVDWFMIVLDEAQNIKNPNTKQSKSIKSLEAEHKIALTGTPVENRLTDYWSIFDFTNKSYLEGSKTFKKNFVNPIEKNRDSTTLEKFKKITSPFILRRMKTDKTIINDLPEKITSECYCPLSKLQTALYQDTIDNVLKEIEESEGIKRKGLVFKLINSLKQICNHPSQFTKSNKFGISESGKMEMLMDILENIEESKAFDVSGDVKGSKVFDVSGDVEESNAVDVLGDVEGSNAVDILGDVEGSKAFDVEKSREKVIIFTQFVQMGKIIMELLDKKFKDGVMFYHGSLSRKARDKIVDDFQNDENSRILIVSLKAGGTGLNLTAATHVIHFDLWWNPAVEEQATDRVYRIGQKENVFVYRFITKGTFEEKINEMLMYKKELAEITVSSEENFVTEMSDLELKELLSLKNQLG